MKRTFFFSGLVAGLLLSTAGYGAGSMYGRELEQIQQAMSRHPAPAGEDKAPPDILPDLTLWSGKRAMDDIATQLSFGVRSPGTPGHQKTIDFIKAEMTEASASVALQPWDYTLPDGTRKRMTNIIARMDPENERRIIIGTHYDSIVHAYRDLDHPEAPMPGANNSASGVALLLETARMLNKAMIHPAFGIDFVFFDGEEGPLSLGAGDPHWVALGSPYFASHLEQWYPHQKPQQAIIFDMVCYKDLKLYPEKLSSAAAGAQVAKFWDIGQKIAPSVFLPKHTGWISDDQTALLEAGIPSFLVIGFEYKPWFNTTQDTLDKCSAGSLKAVGDTLVTYLFQSN